jgi:hypothetical protein
MRFVQQALYTYSTIVATNQRGVHGQGKATQGARVWEYVGLAVCLVKFIQQHLAAGPRTYGKGE